MSDRHEVWKGDFTGKWWSSGLGENTHFPTWREAYDHAYRTVCGMRKPTKVLERTNQGENK